jgi:curved DNA-binding protein CbpA
MLQRVPAEDAARPLSPAEGEGKGALPAKRGEGGRSSAPGSSRGLPAPEVTASAAIAAGLAWAGPLSKESALRLYYLAAAAQATGRLTLAGEKGAYALTFKKGTPEHACSTYPEDELGPFLVRRGMVRPEQAAEAEAVKAGFGDELVGALLGLRLVNPADIFRALQEYGIALVWRALAAESRTGRWEPGAAPPSSSFPLGAPWALLCDAVRRIDVARVRLRLGTNLARSAVRVGGRISVEELHLTPQEARICGLFDGVRSVEEIAASRPNEVEAVLRLALLLSEAELLAFGAERRPEAPEPHAAVAAAPPPAAKPVPVAVKTAPASPNPRAVAPRPTTPAAVPAARPSSAAPPPAARQVVPPAPQQAALDLSALRAAAAWMENADHFQVLGVKRDASAAQIKTAYFQLAKLYHPDASPPGDSPEARKTRADVFAKVSASWGVLGDDQERAHYLELLESGGVGEVDVSVIFQAEQLFETATVLVKGRKYDEAAKKLDEAILLNADEPEFGVWKAWIDFLLAPEDEKAAQQRSSASAIEAALRLNPRCMPGYLFLGQMARLTGDTVAAEKHFKRGLALDSENVELQRELKYLKR